MGNIIVALILITIVGAVIYGMVKDKRSGKSGCSHGCENCAMHGQCHSIGTEKK